MMTAHQLRSLIVMLAFEWQLSSEDPFLFCYRIGWSLFEFPSGDSARHGVYYS
jgi:hypothetical protein